MKKAHHTCTDPICCMMFLIFLCFFGVVYGYGLINGDIERLYRGIGQENGVSVFCGLEPVADKPYIYWCATAVNSLSGVPTSINLGSPVCVSTCPQFNVSSGLPFVSLPVLECFNTSGASLSYPTKQISSYCLPDSNVPGMQEFVQNISNTWLSDGHEGAMELLSSIPPAWPLLLTSFLAATVLGFLYLTLLRCCAEPLIWGSMITAIIGSALFGTYLWVNAGSLVDPEATPGILQENMPEAAGENEENATKALAIFCWTMSAVLVCVLCCFHSSIKIAATVTEVACEVIWEVPGLLVAPLFKAIIKGVFCCFLMYGFLSLWTTGELMTAGDGLTRTFTHDEKDVGLIIFFMFCSFWILAFLDAVFQFSLAFVVGEYYFTPPTGPNGERVVPCCAFFDGLELALFTHAGSLALGSALVAILQTVQKIIEYAEKQNKETANNPCVSCILCCCLCCVHCCKEMVEAINKNAYIDIAITIPSPSFCRAAQNVLKMITDIGGAMAVLNGATFVFTVFGSFVITTLCGALTYVLLHNCEMFTDQNGEYRVDSGAVVVVCAMLIAFFVAIAFMNVFDMTADTLIICYGHDLSLNNGGPTAPIALKELFHNGAATSRK